MGRWKSRKHRRTQTEVEEPSRGHRAIEGRCEAERESSGRRRANHSTSGRDAHAFAHAWRNLILGPV